MFCDIARRRSNQASAVKARCSCNRRPESLARAMRRCTLHAGPRLSCELTPEQVRRRRIVGASCASTAACGSCSARHRSRGSRRRRFGGRQGPAGPCSPLAAVRARGKAYHGSTASLVGTYSLQRHKSGLTSCSAFCSNDTDAINLGRLACCVLAGKEYRSLWFFRNEEPHRRIPFPSATPQVSQTVTHWRHLPLARCQGPDPQDRAGARPPPLEHPPRDPAQPVPRGQGVPRLLSRNRRRSRQAAPAATAQAGPGCPAAAAREPDAGSLVVARADRRPAQARRH